MNCRRLILHYTIRLCRSWIPTDFFHSHTIRRLAVCPQRLRNTIRWRLIPTVFPRRPHTIRRRSIHRLILPADFHEQGPRIDHKVAYNPFCAIPDPLSHSRSVVHLRYVCPGTQKSKDVVCWKLLLS